MLKYFLYTLVTLSTLVATDLDKKIELLKSVPKEQRYKIMNEIKKELVKLNEAQRSQMLKYFL